MFIFRCAPSAAGGHPCLKASVNATRRERRFAFMRKSLLLATVALVMALGAGCANTLPTEPYEPQTVVRLEGSTDIGEFEYLPLKNGKVKKPNQIRNTALGGQYISANIADYVKRGTALELEKSGIVLDSSCPYSINGNIIEFLCDDFGYSITWEYSIQYIIKEKITGTVLFDKVFTPEPKKTGKFGFAKDFSSVMSEMVLAGYEMFAREPSVQKILSEIKK